MKLEWDPDYVPGVKLGLHTAQIVLSFVLWCLEIAVFRADDAEIVGQNGWTFGVVGRISRMVVQLHTNIRRL